MATYQIKAHKVEFLMHNNQFEKNDPIWNKDKNLLCQHLWCHIFRASTIRVRYFILFNIRLWKTKISNFYFALNIKKNILKFNISEKNIMLMKIFKTIKDLIKNNLSFFFIESFHLLKVVIKISIRTIFETKYNIIFSFKSVVQIN